MKKESINLWSIMMAVIILITGITIVYVFVILPMGNIQTKIGTIIRIEVTSGGDFPRDKCVIAFSDGSTLILTIEAFGQMEKYVNETVNIRYMGYVLKDINLVKE
jgi:competence transcription factor ComK